MAKSRLSKMIAKIDKTFLAMEKNAIVDNGKPACPGCNDNTSVVRSWQTLSAIKAGAKDLLKEAIETRWWCWTCRSGFTSPPSKQEEVIETPEVPVFGAVTEVNDA